MSSVEQIRKEVEALYKSYGAAFNGRDASAISECFACPCALVTGEQGLIQFASTGELRGMLGKLLADLKERGWTRSEMDQIKVWPIADDLVMVLADATRYKADGSVLESVRACYMVRCDGKNWKIVTVSEVQPPFLGPGDLLR